MQGGSVEQIHSREQLGVQPGAHCYNGFEPLSVKISARFDQGACPRKTTG